jgi:phage protein D
MNNTVQNRQGSSFSVTYPDFPSFSLLPLNLRIYQEAGKQDVVDITYTQFTPFYTKSFKTGVPVKIVWNNGTESNTLYGYVYNVAPKTQQTMQRTTVIRVIGASLALKESATKIWTNMSASDIVTDIAKQFKLKPVVTADVTKFAQQSMIGHTYWEKIQELAERVGYVAQMLGTELHFHQMDTMIDMFATTIPVLSFNDPYSNPWASVKAQTLDSFTPRIGDYTDLAQHNRSTKVVTGVHPVTGKTYKVTSSPNAVGKALRTSTKDPLFNEVMPTTITDSVVAAQKRVDAQAQLSRFNIMAKGAGQGDPRLSPYRTVEINGTGDTTDGYWIIKKIEHFITADGRYQIEFSCMTDGTGKSKGSSTRSVNASTIPVRNIPYEMSTGITSEKTVSTLSSPTAMISQTNTGFNVTLRRWVGK